MTSILVKLCILEGSFEGSPFGTGVVFGDVDADLVAGLGFEVGNTGE